MAVARIDPSVLHTVLGVLCGPLTRRTSRGGETTLGDVVADALQAGAAPFHRNVAALIDPADLQADFPAPRWSDSVELTVRDALRALPLWVRATVVTLTGDQLHRAFEAQFAGRGVIMQVSSQLAYQWRLAPSGRQRIDPRTITIGGTVVDPAADYVIAVSDGLRGRRGNPVIAAAPPIGQGVVGVGGAHPGLLFDNLAAYLSTRSPLPVPTLGRITRVV
jgi:5'-nucleotidase